MGRFAPSRIGGFSTLTVLAVISIYPFVWMVLTSLRDRNTVFTGPFIPEQFKFGAYPEAWRETNFGHHLRNTVVIAGLSLLGIMVLSTTAGYAFAKLRFPFKRTIYILLLSTMAMPATSLVIPLYLQVKRLGLLDSTLGLILVYVGSMSPFSIFLMRAFFATLAGRPDRSGTPRRRQRADDLPQGHAPTGQGRRRHRRHPPVPRPVERVPLRQRAAPVPRQAPAAARRVQPRRRVQHAVERAHRRAGDGDRARSSSSTSACRNGSPPASCSVRSSDRAASPPPPEKAPPMPVHPIRFVDVNVTDLDRSVDFYTRHLELPVIDTSQFEGDAGVARRRSCRHPPAPHPSTRSRRDGSPTTCSSGSATSGSPLPVSTNAPSCSTRPGCASTSNRSTPPATCASRSSSIPTACSSSSSKATSTTTRCGTPTSSRRYRPGRSRTRPTFDHVAMTVRDHDVDGRLLPQHARLRRRRQAVPERRPARLRHHAISTPARR